MGGGKHWGAAVLGVRGGDWGLGSALEGRWGDQAVLWGAWGMQAMLGGTGATPEH